jgi:excinuclease ABC subunit B
MTSTKSPFKLVSAFQPAGGQPQAIKKLISGFNKHKMQTLLGITGSGKTFCMAKLIEQVGIPTLVLAHNKTLAAQLYEELKILFPENRVEYFISYYDYYQPESYLPTSDTYIEKDASVNEQIEKMRLRTTASLLSRKDVIVVASISCIYGLGNPENFKLLSLPIKQNQKITRRKIIKALVAMQYDRNPSSLEAGQFRIKGDTIDVFPPYDDHPIRIELFDDKIDKISERHKVTGEQIANIKEFTIYPAKQFVVPEEKTINAIQEIKDELKTRLPELQALEKQRLKQRVKYDLEMIEELGYCSGIENYSRHFEGRDEGTPPHTLLNYFPDDFLLIIDESHQTIPQSHAMYKGDYARKKNLIDFGFRLPSAFDNRPLKFKEFEKFFKHVVCVSATPANYELEKSGQVVELDIRPTGLLDPTIEVKPIDGQIKDLLIQIKATTNKGDRTLITTLTKRMAEDLTDYLSQAGINVRYMHSDIQSLDRIELIRALRAGEYNVLVGINLLREGLDIPEVSLVAILDADKEGFLRNERSLIQTIGRAARNENGRVILYANKITESIRRAVAITKQRRRKQQLFNKEHNITPKTIKKQLQEKTREVKGIKHLGKSQLQKQMLIIKTDMKKAAEQLDFEKAIELRNVLKGMEHELQMKQQQQEYLASKKQK